MIKREYRDYIKGIIDSIKDIKEFVRNMKYNEFICDKKTVNAVVRSIEVIGEATKKIPKSMKNKYSEVPWKKMAGIRDKLIHEYFGVDISILWEQRWVKIAT